MHLPWLDFGHMKDLKNRSPSSQCYLKNQVQKKTFIIIDKSMVVKLQRTFIKFVTVNTSLK